MYLLKRNWCFLLGMWLVTCFNHAKADTWWDPSAKEMLDSSDVIALVEYSSEGSDYAAAKVLRIYKGVLVAGNEIYISGFSNQYGPHDMMHIGDQYIVFLNLMKPWGSANEYFEKAANNDPRIMKFADALFQNNAYYVWTPTAGDYQVENGRVKFDLLNTGYHGNAALHSRKEFDTFLAAYFEPAKRASFERKLIRKIKPASDSDDKTQALMMLYLLDYQAYNPIFEDYVHVKNEYSRFALTQVLGNIHNKASDAVLLLLLDDRSSLVQGSSVRAMALCDPEIIGPALLSRLKDAGEYNLGPTSLMDPVRNSLSGGKYQIIETLGDIGYTPAIPTLLGMLETRNEDDFEHIVDALRKLGTDEYARYINLHLDSLHHNMVYTLGQIIVRDSLSQCIPSLMYYISHHDRSFYPTEEKAVSYYAGLGFFKSDAVLKFLSGDFVELMKTPYTGDVAYDTKLDWVKEYLLTYMHLGIDPHKDLVYDFMYEYYGFNSRFRYEPVYFQKQQNIEDSITEMILEVLLPLEPNVIVSTRAFVDSNYNLLDYVSKFQIPKPDNFVLQKINRLDTLTEVVSEKTTIDNRHLIAEAANSSKSYGGGRMKAVNSDLMMIFLNYISVFADEKDVSFIENLIKYYCANDSSALSMLNEYLEKARINASKKANKQPATIVTAADSNAAFPFELSNRINTTKITSWQANGELQYSTWIPDFFGIEDLKVAIVQNITTDEDYGLPVRNTNLSFFNADSLLFTFDEEFLHDEKISVLQDPMQMADINGDGLLDIKLIFRHWGSGRLNLFTRVYYLFQTPDHTFDAFYVQYLMLNGSNDAEYDIDGDGNFEIVTMSYDLDWLIFRTFNYLDGKIVNVDEKFDYPLVSGIDFNASEIQYIKPVQEVDVKELKPVEFIKMN